MTVVQSVFYLSVLPISDVAPHSVPLVDYQRQGLFFWVPTAASHGRPIDYFWSFFSLFWPKTNLKIGFVTWNPALYYKEPITLLETAYLAPPERSVYFHHNQSNRTAKLGASAVSRSTPYLSSWGKCLFCLCQMCLFHHPTWSYRSLPIHLDRSLI